MNLILQNKNNAYFSPRKARDADGVAKKMTTAGRSHCIGLSSQVQVRLSVLIYFKSISCATILLQDSVLLRDQFPRHPIWNDSIFIQKDYQEFAKQMVFVFVQSA